MTAESDEVMDLALEFAAEVAKRNGDVPEKLRCKAARFIREHAPRETYDRLADEVRERRGDT